MAPRKTLSGFPEMSLFTYLSPEHARAATVKSPFLSLGAFFAGVPPRIHEVNPQNRFTSPFNPLRKTPVADTQAG
jgi:hypothetical protein